MEIHPLRKHEYDAFLALRQKVFGDDPAWIASFDRCFADSVRHFVLTEDGRVAAALTQFEMGRLMPSAQRILISYAICTDPADRGKGYGSTITEFARELARKEGCLSALSPAEPRLIDFYAPLGYAPLLFAERHAATTAPAEAPGFRAERLTPNVYGTLRENALSGRLHVALSEQALTFARQTSLDGSGLFLLGNDEAICTCEEGETPDTLTVSEVLSLSADETHADAAARLLPQLLCKLNKQSAVFTCPARKDAPAATALGLVADLKTSASDDELPGYLGYTFG